MRVIFITHGLPFTPSLENEATRQGSAKYFVLYVYIILCLGLRLAETCACIASKNRGFKGCWTRKGV